MRRRYTRADAGPDCDTCGFPMVKALAAAGDSTHPTCSGDFEDMLEALARTLRKVTAMTETIDLSPGVNAATLLVHGDSQAKDPTTTVTAVGVPAPGGTPPSTPGSISERQVAKLHATFFEAGITRRDAKLAFCTDTVFRTITTSTDLSRNEAGQVIDALERIIGGTQ